MGAISSLLKTKYTTDVITQNVLVWLDDSIKESNDNRHMQEQLRTVISKLETFTDGDKCEEYIRSCSINTQITFIVSGTFGQELIPRLHDLENLVSIYVYCSNKEKSKEWSAAFSKVKRIIIHPDGLIDRIRSDFTSRSLTTVDELHSSNVLSTSASQRPLADGLNELDFQQQLLFDCLLHMKWTEQDKEEFIAECQKILENNVYELAILREFQESYSANQAVFWYTRNSFLHRMINVALNNQDTDKLLLLRFLIQDTQEQLKQNQCSSLIRLYRQQLMPNERLQVFQNAKGEHVSINSFLVANLDRAWVLAEFDSFKEPRDDVHRVLFEIVADPGTKGVKPFAALTSFLPNANSSDVLVMLGSIVKIKDIHQEENGMWIIQMELSSADDHNLKPMFDEIKSRYYPEDGNTNLFSYSLILLDMGKLDAAEKYIQRYLTTLTDDHPDTVQCFDTLGHITLTNDELDASLEWHKKSLKIKTEASTPNCLSSVNNCNSIGYIFQKKSEYPQALEYYQKVLIICKEALCENDPMIASCYGNIGKVYQMQEEQQSALVCYQKMYAILLTYYPPDHFDFAALYTNIAIAYTSLGHYEIALGYYQMSLKIKLQYLDPQDPSIAKTLENIGVIFESQGDFFKAQDNFEKAADIYRHNFSSLHPNIVQIAEHIQRVSSSPGHHL